MRVWIVEATEPLPVVDGNFRDLRCGMLAKALLASGHEVVWWSSTFDHMRKTHRFDGPHSMEVQPGLRINLMHGPGYSKNVSLHRVRHNRTLARTFQRQICQSQPQPDVLFACLPIPELAEAATLYGRERQIPVIVDARDQWPDLYLTVFPPRLRALARIVLQTEFRRTQRVFQRASGITAVSQTYLDWALNCAKRPARGSDGVFHLGYPQPAVNTNEIEGQAQQLRLKHDIRSHGLIVTFIGTFGASYDLETVVRAAAQLQASGVSDTQIVLAGAGDKSPKLRELASGLENIVFTGWLDQSAMLALLRLSSVGLVAYRNEALQSLPNKPFEYMAAGLLMLSSLRGELETLIRNEQIGLQYEAGNVDSLVERIRWLEVNRGVCREMGARARKLLVERFSVETIYPELVHHLEGIARKFSGSSKITGQVLVP